MVAATLPRPEHPARRRTRHLYAAVTVGLVVTAVFALAFVGLCWGNYGVLGAVLCRLHLLLALWILGVCAVLVLLAKDLAEPHVQRFEGRRLKHARAAWHGYTQLERDDAFHVRWSTLASVVFVLALLLIAIFSPIVL